MELAQRLHGFLDTLAASGNPVIRHLVAGPDAADQVALAEPHGVRLHDDLLTWFAIVGGIDAANLPPSDESWFSPVFQPLTLTEALDRRDEIVSWHGDPAKYDMYLPGIERFLPLGKCGMLLHCAVTGQGDPTVHRFDPPDVHDTYMDARWPTVGAMAAEWEQRWRDGLYRYEPGSGVRER